MTIYSAGKNLQGNLGLGNTSQTSTPTAQADTTWKRIAVCSETTFEHALGIKDNGTLWGVGSGGNSRLGIAVALYSLWTRIGSETSWAEVATGHSHTLALKTDGTLWATGNNGNGQCGVTGGGATITAFTQVGSDTTWAKIAAGSYCSFGIKIDGTLWAWGLNGSNGQLGLGTTTASYTTPQQVGSDTTWASISFKDSHAVATKTAGTLWAWGRNNLGQLGQGNTTTPVRSPTQIGSSTDWAIAVAGDATTHCIKTTGTLWACGSGAYYGLGTGNTSNQTSLTQIGSATDWAYLAAGSQYQILVKTDGTIYVVGRNAGGQLGTGNETDVTTLTALSLSIPVAKVVSGGYSTHFGLPAVDYVPPEPTTGATGSPTVYQLSAILRDGVADDFDFSISSFALSKRDADTSYYSLSCQFTDSLITALGAMPDGVIHIIRDGVEWEYFNIAAPVRYDIGPRSASISINGTRQETNEEPEEFIVTEQMAISEGINSSGLLTLDVVPGFIDASPGDVLTWDGSDYTLTLIKFQANSGGQTLNLTCTPV